MSIHLILAVFWILLGGGVVVAAWLGVPQARPIGGAGVFGWFAIVLGLWKLARWYNLRSAQQQRQWAELPRQRNDDRSPSPPAREPDPNFLFTEPDRQDGPRP